MLGGVVVPLNNPVANVVDFGDILREEIICKTF
jgi:hypothetical protein